jgi:hypothetical protein
MALIQNLVAMLKSNGYVRLQSALQSSPTNVYDKMGLRRRVTLAEINAGTTILPALFGYKYRVTDMRMISIGGAVGATTTVDILGTQSAASVKLLAVAIAALTQSAVVRAGAANASVLADGASFAECDVNTGISVSKTGATATTATAVDVELDFEVVESA